MSTSNNNILNSSNPIFSLRSIVDDLDATNPSNDVVKGQDRLLPIANVGRIMKHMLPPNAKISKEAKETMQECASEFIGFVTSEASEKCRKERRKTVNGDDICWAMGNLGFDDYAGPLKRYLDKYREVEMEKGNNSNNNNQNNYKGSNSEDYMEDNCY
ncbi:Nuclear transcription factor Y subunit B-5 [Castilleja foliolosa]|uniref:Nuclear transcription factor Y subunit B-5 n=1 Tax=Castilleja foliolosa TaxID=1961234 RepID=A0ABD3CB02_9LAMI